MIALSVNAQIKSKKNERWETDCPQEVLPTFPGGIEKFKAFVAKNLKWPKDDGFDIEGRILVQFFVEKDGSLTEIKVVKGLSPAYDQEAINLMKKSPKWIPATQMHKPVRIRYFLPIPFHVSKS